MAFMVPLVKNHYDIYNTRTTSISQHDSGYLLSASSQLSGLSNSNNLRTNSNNGKSPSNQTVVLNGLVLMNGRTNTKPKVILSARNAKKQQKSSQQSSKKLTPEVQQKSNEQEKQQQQSQQRSIKKQPSPMSYSTSTQSMNTTRSFPHVRRTVRNPITKRVYSYSVSIPEYVAEEDEEELAALELEDEQRDDQLDQLVIFSTSAPAGTGSIDNGIIDVVDEDEFIRCTGARLPSAISNHRRSSKQLPLKSSSSRNECNHLTKSLPKNNENTENNNGNFLESSDNNNNGGSTTPTSPGSASTSSSSDVEYENCPSANSREYMELLQKFILHLKMLKLKRIFKNKNRSTNSSKNCNNEQRSRSSTLNDSNNL